MRIFPNVTATTEFAVLGLEAAGLDAAQLTTTGFSVRYDAVAGHYLIDVPAYPAGAFHEHTANTPTTRYWSGTLVEPGTNATVGGDVSVFKPSPTNETLALSYTTFAMYDVFRVGTTPYGFVAFGSPTPVGGVPVSGSATYTATLIGSTLNSPDYLVGGSATLAFNFAAGTLSGHFEPTLHYLGGMGDFDELGRYDFVNTVFGVGSTTFSGALSKAQVPGLGSFGGRFTGPNAQELMASWTAPFVDPVSQQPGQMFGVLVGKD